MNTTQAQMELRTIAQLADPQLRSALISTAENVEKMLKSKKISPGQLLGHTLPYGLRVEVVLDYKGEDKPTVFTFTYRLDKTIMTRWLSENPHLTEGILSFVGKGIEITIPPINHGVVEAITPWKDIEKQIDKTGFSIDNINKERDFLPLLERPITFKVHRNIFGGKEWECFYVDEQQ